MTRQTQFDLHWNDNVKLWVSLPNNDNRKLFFFYRNHYPIMNNFDHCVTWSFVWEKILKYENDKKRQVCC